MAKINEAYFNHHLCCLQKTETRIYPVQIPANRGPDSRFVFEANFKPLVPKSNSSQVIKLMDQGRVTWPQGKYWVTISHFWDTYISKKVKKLHIQLKTDSYIEGSHFWTETYLYAWFYVSNCNYLYLPLSTFSSATMDFTSYGYANNRYYPQLLVSCEVLPAFTHPCIVVQFTL